MRAYWLTYFLLRPVWFANSKRAPKPGGKGRAAAVMRIARGPSETFAEAQRNRSRAAWHDIGFVAAYLCGAFGVDRALRAIVESVLQRDFRRPIVLLDAKRKIERRIGRGAEFYVGEFAADRQSRILSHKSCRIGRCGAQVGEAFGLKRYGALNVAHETVAK